MTKRVNDRLQTATQVRFGKGVRTISVRVKTEVRIATPGVSQDNGIRDANSTGTT
jgi:hypothetical protein